MWGRMTGIDNAATSANIITLNSVDLVSIRVWGLNTMEIGQNEI